MSIRRTHIEFSIAFSSKGIFQRLNICTIQMAGWGGGGGCVQMIRYVEKKISQFLEGVSLFFSRF